MKFYAQISKQLYIRPQKNTKELSSLVAEVFAAVEAAGDKALRDYSQKFDNIVPAKLVWNRKDMLVESRAVPDKLKNAINTAAKNIELFHRSQTVVPKIVETAPGVRCWQETRAIERVGLYVPGGSAPLVSTVLMLGIPARIAGCKEVVLCTPPNAAGLPDPAVCYAAYKVGVDRLLVLGGIQAVAAMTVGTPTVPAVDKLFGPGNQYVTAAKQYAIKYGVATDLPAGPSEVMVIADDTARPEFVAADLLSQAEHGPDSQVVLVTTSRSLYKAVSKELARQLKTLPRREIARQALGNSYCLLVKSLEAGMVFANRYAPEHLLLNVQTPETLAKQVQNAGSVFLGGYSPESAGDYASGTNHTLPTNGWARSTGGVDVANFQKTVSFQSLTKDGLAGLSETIETLANAEGLDAHARAVTIRLNKKETRDV